MDGLNVAVGSCVGISDGVFVGSSNDGVSVGETQRMKKSIAIRNILQVDGESDVGEFDGLNVAVGSCVGASDGVCVGISNEGGNVGETQTNENFHI